MLHPAVIWPLSADLFWVGIAVIWTGVTFIATPRMLRRIAG